jgi:hypothetical protein
MDPDLQSLLLFFVHHEFIEWFSYKPSCCRPTMRAVESLKERGGLKEEVLHPIIPLQTRRLTVLLTECATLNHNMEGQDELQKHQNW